MRLRGRIGGFGRAPERVVIADPRRVEIEIRGRVESLHLEPGDKLIVTIEHPRGLTPDFLDELRAQFKLAFPDHEVAFLHGLSIAKQVA